MQRWVMAFLQVAGRYAAAYFALVTAFVLALVLVCAFPGDSIRDNVRKSLPLLQQEGDYPRRGGIQPDHQLDNFIDSIMLNIAYSVDSRTPLDAAMRDALYTSPDQPHLRVESLRARVETDAQVNDEYPRYWHGYLVIIRPLLALTTYSGIRRLSQVVFLLLFTIVMLLLYRRLSIFAALAFAAAMALVDFTVIPLSMHFSGVFFIAFVSMAIFLLSPRASTQQVALLFFVIGGLTSFLDILTVPLVTFGLPAVVVLMQRTQAQQENSAKKDIIFLTWIGLSWTLGYGLSWIAKWGLASIVLGRDIVADGIGKIVERTGALIPVGMNDGTPLFIHAILSNTAMLYFASPLISRVLLILSPFMFAACLVRWHQDFHGTMLALLLFSVALMPYLWFAVASNHFAIHYWFTYRMQAVSIMGALSAMYYAIDWNKCRKDGIRLARSWQSWRHKAGGLG